MTSSYEDIYSRFLQKCTDYDFIELDEETVYDNMEGWLHSVASLPYVRVKFKTFSLNDEVLKMNWELKNSIDDNSDELFVIEVFAQGMIIQWLEPKVKSILNVKQFFGGTIVTVDQKEMALGREELLLWSCLMWEILTKEEVKTYFLKKAVRMDVSQERFDAVLQRLEVRQLVVSAQAEKGDIALYRLLAKLYVIPLESSFMVKVQAFFRFIFFEKLPLTVAKNVFQKEN